MYSSAETQRPLNEASDAKIEPPIHAEYLRSEEGRREIGREGEREREGGRNE